MPSPGLTGIFLQSDRTGRDSSQEASQSLQPLFGPHAIEWDILDLEGIMPLRVALPKFRRSGQADRPMSHDEAVAAATAAVAAMEKDDDKATMRKRRVLRMTTIVFVALAAGQYVQSARTGGGGRAEAAATPLHSPLASNAGVEAQPRAMLVPVSLVAKSPVPKVSAGVSGAGAGGVVLISASPEDRITLPQMPAPVAAPACEQTLGLTAAPGAMLDLTLTAPCHPGERVVLRHAGLTVTGKTDAGGMLVMAVPALDAGGAVAVEFADGTELRGAAKVPDLAGLHRLALQWAAGDAFALHGLENGAGLQTAGDVSAANPGKMPDGSGKKLKTGWLVALGDAEVTAPLLAEVYTYPADTRRRADVAILAQVGAGTCGHEMMGQTLASVAGAVSVTDLTLSMPACDGKTGYLVLKNLFPDMKIASSN